MDRPDRKLNWEEDIPKFDLPSKKLLYMIFYLFEQKQLDADQKRKLKQLVIIENPKIFQAYSQFEKIQSPNDLANNLKKLYNEEVQGSINKDYSKSIIHKAFESTMINGPKSKEDDDNIDCLNSPMGGELMDRKKKKQSKAGGKHKKEDSESKTFISRAIGKMKNNSDSDS